MTQMENDSAPAASQPKATSNSPSAGAGDAPRAEPTLPLVFISHRHSDQAIAKAVADWLSIATSNRVDVFRSSDGLKGVEVARSITDQIRRKVAEASVMIAIYTDQDADWAWVMFEMGIAMDPTTPVTRVVVLQCGEDAPAILSDFKRVHATVAADRIGFARDLLSEGFFPTHLDLRLAGPKGADDLAKDQADLLWSRLRELVPPPDSRKREWSPYPRIRVEVPLSALGDLSGSVDTDRLEGWRLPIKEQGRVVREDDTRSIFSLNALEGQTLAELETALGLASQSEWINSCVHHLTHCLVGNRLMQPMTGVVSSAGVSFQPLVERVQHKWFDKVVRFDIIFIQTAVL